MYSLKGNYKHGALMFLLLCFSSLLVVYANGRASLEGYFGDLDDNA